ncbi:uncharacterized protein MEPE_00357 [Melanopsichium pennsylvanicum]|uniref:Protein kinase domain-containing protein n=2 Tax=Melanopsichium pennsylvanicum TaxID=63383 RepID=A0AAJ4XG00_9BASI|nr:serine threonine protein kinase [Melanopsichium pennsylvanicum 4]SNX81652.1 uncharacterized protein MEPE_00357 [Melanopsichium pennsylvanicum]
MSAHISSSDAPSWRRGGQPNSAPQPVPAPSQRGNHAHRKDKDKLHDNWRANAHPIASSSINPHQASSNHSQPVAIAYSSSYDRHANGSAVNGHSARGTPSLLSSSLKRETAGMLDANWVTGDHPHPHPNTPHTIKPSSMGTGLIGRAPEFGTSPTKPNASGFAAARYHWPLSSSLEKTQAIGPATYLQPLRIEPNEASRFFSTASTPFKPNHHGQQQSNHEQQKQEATDRNNNWMLTPTSSLPSIPSTPNHLRESSMERSLADGPNGAKLRPTPLIKGPVEQFQSSNLFVPRTPSPGHGLARQENSVSGTSLFNRGPSVNIHSSPKRSPLVASNFAQRQQPGSVSGNPVMLSPTSSPKLSHRTLSPMTRHPPVIAEAHSNGDRVVNSIASMLSSASPQPRPTTASRRESFNSVVSGGVGHTMSHSRRSSAVFSPNSPTVATRIGVYRPPHLRNRGSISDLKPSVAHYDRVRTPSLRGLSRSRESSVSLSRPGSRPPSTVPFYHNESIPEDEQNEEATRPPLRGRQSYMSIHLPDLIAEQQQRNAANVAAAPNPEDNQPRSLVSNTSSLLEQPLDSASLLAKLRAQLVRREAAASDVAASEIDRDSVVTEDSEQDFFDLSEMMEYGASESHSLSRQHSTYAIEGHPLGDVFEIGDLLGPGLEHDGHIIKIAETTTGFVDQNEDLTGSKLEVIRKLGEGSYAAVYLVKEVSAEEAAEHTSQKSMAIPNSSSRSGVSGVASQKSNEDTDLTMVASSEDLLSTTLKAHGKDRGDGFHNSPALEERRRKDLKIDTRLRPGKEFALKCLCKRDLPEDMLEVQRLEATIHQSIPAHPNIVTLYRTYETPNWLFLVLEYCPGQDLYYWLEQAQDTSRPTGSEEEEFGKTYTDNDHAESMLHRKLEGSSGNDNYRVRGSSLDATPPSPSLLATTSGHILLSKRRIRLIARMFRQICDAVQFCHDRGVSHRDIKPENFIVEDRRTVEQMQSACPDTSASTLVDSTRDGDDTQVIVKMTDFGLATAEDRCDDFDCGSKPYMAFECHNNVSATYDPKQADVWSLGVVLLNLLFHRSPFTEPSMNCPSFAAYCQEPIHFLMDSFDGLTETVAQFLSENVFCSISDNDDASQKRISASEFSHWASGLVDHMGLSGSGPGRISRGASMYTTNPLIHSRTGSMSTLPSLLSSPRPRARSLARDTDYVPDLDMAADVTLRATFAAAGHGSVSPQPALFTPDVLPSPTFTPSPQPPDRNPFDTQYGAIAEAERGPQTVVEQEEQRNLDATQNGPHHTPNDLPPSNLRSFSNDALEKLGLASYSSRTRLDVSSDAALYEASRKDEVELVGADIADEVLPEIPEHAVSGEQGDENAGIDDDAGPEEDADHNDSAEAGGGANGSTEVGDKPESVTTSNHSKRRKRGARKGRTLAKQLKRSQSVEGMTEADDSDPAARARERERTIRELALASENLARQMSKMTKPSDAIDGLTSPQITLSKPTAEAAARYSLQSMNETDGDATQLSSTTSTATPATNWTSAAMRRDRMSEHRKTGASVLQDSGRSRVMSWRERNQSVATLSSLASSVTTTSSFGSNSSATSSIYSTASAPAAVQRKDFSARNRTRGSGFGLDTISEREKAAPTKKEVDAKYLAGIFGGGDGPQKKRESTAGRSVDNQSATLRSSVQTQNGASVTLITAEKSDKGSNMFDRLSDSSKTDGAPAHVSPTLRAPNRSQQTIGSVIADGAGQRSVSASSVKSDASSSGVAASFVSRFRRPTSSSSTNKVTSGAEAELARANTIEVDQSLETTVKLGTSIVTRRDASTRTSRLDRVGKDDVSIPASTVTPTKSNGSSSTNNSSKTTKSTSSSTTNTTTNNNNNNNITEADSAPKKRGMGKFLLGVRDSIKKF